MHPVLNHSDQDTNLPALDIVDLGKSKSVNQEDALLGCKAVSFIDGRSPNVCALIHIQNGVNRLAVIHVDGCVFPT